MCVCVREREGGREGAGERKRQDICMYTCVGLSSL